MTKAQYLLVLDCEGDLTKGQRAPWHIAAQLIDSKGENFLSLNVLIQEGLGLYPSRESDQHKLLAQGIETKSYLAIRKFLHKAIQPLLDNGNSVIAISWGAKDFPNLGKGFLPQSVTYANAIEIWAETCPVTYTAPITAKGKPKVTLKDVFNFEIGQVFNWHNAADDVEALIKILAVVIRRGEIKSYNHYFDFHRFPTQIVYNRVM